jgi:hypothetical protein
MVFISCHCSETSTNVVVGVPRMIVPVGRTRTRIGFIVPVTTQDDGDPIKSNII